VPSFAAPSARGSVDASTDRRPPLLLVAVDISPERGSEPGKAWSWACALSRHYRLHIVTGPVVDERCRDHPVAREWTWHFTPSPQPVGMGWTYYRDYIRWCREAIVLVRDVLKVVPVVGLHHVTLGSFRVLPRYDCTGLPYTLGPLGGGEVAPRNFIRTFLMPWRAQGVESVRPWLNWACAMRPGARTVLRKARLVLTTTAETERLMRRVGVTNTGIAFPDCTPRDAVTPVLTMPDDDRVRLVGRRVRLIWNGRAVWWKGGQIAIELLRRLVQAGVDCELAMYSLGPAVDIWRARIGALGLSERCRLPGYVDRHALLMELGRTHVFVYPTLHDSSTSALLEAYAMGVPSLTIGVGGPALVATPETGMNESAKDPEAWLRCGVERVRQWQRDPMSWLAASRAARARAAEFGPEHVEHSVERWLAPAIYAK
jgi:glycosyltransferase involved in cell wall biosynthesis